MNRLWILVHKFRIDLLVMLKNVQKFNSFLLASFFNQIVPFFSCLFCFGMFFKDLLSVWFYSLQNVVLSESFNDVIFCDGTCKNAKNNAFSFETADPLYILLKRFLRVGLPMSQLVVANEI